uniref:Cyt-Co n=1 Tax=Conidiobolus obscurus TaxID=164418 RepID=A0A4Y5RWU8_9FUNG|nr:Cyt-Co [Conidiobolus obscurus]
MANPTFESIDNAPDNFIGTVSQVQKFCQEDISISKQKFDWDNFQNRVKSRSDADLTISEVKSNKIIKNEAKVELMVTELVDFLKNALAVAVSGGEELALKTAIDKVFTGLSKSNQDAWIFHQASSGYNSAWEYRLLYSFPRGDSKKSFLTLVLTFFIESKVEKEKILWITTKDISNFKVELTSCKLLVLDTFKA